MPLLNSVSLCARSLGDSGSLSGMAVMVVCLWVGLKGGGGGMWGMTAPCR